MHNETKTTMDKQPFDSQFRMLPTETAGRIDCWNQNEFPGFDLWDIIMSFCFFSFFAVSFVRPACASQFEGGLLSVLLFIVIIISRCSSAE